MTEPSIKSRSNCRNYNANQGEPLTKVIKPLNLAYTGQVTMPLRSKSDGPTITASRDKARTCLRCKDLSPIQFMIGIMGCIQEEASNTVKSNMLEYGRHLLLDALETNWATARHAHLMLLQEINRGKCSWRRPDAIEKTRIRNTARVITTKARGTAPKSGKHNSRDKVCTDFNSNNCKFPGDHIGDGQIVKHACSFCFKETG